MMIYEVFKNVVASRIKEYLPPVFGAFDVQVRMVPKLNGMKEALIMSMEWEEQMALAPNIYLDDLYEDFMETEDLDLALTKAAEIILAFTTTRPKENDYKELADFKGEIVKVLVNTERNRDLLADIPHQDWLDLSVIYRMVVDHGPDEGFSTALLTKDIQQCLGLSDSELASLAEENGREKFKVKCLPVSENMQVLTTDSGIYGAAALLRTDEIKKISEAAGDNLYLVPSSMHEVIVFNAQDCDSDSLRKIHKEGNEMYTDNEDFLSNNIYYYCRESDEIVMAV